MSYPFAQRKVQEVLVATYTPPFIEALRVDVLQRPIELAPDLGKVVSRQGRPDTTPLSRVPPGADVSYLRWQLCLPSRLPVPRGVNINGKEVVDPIGPAVIDTAATRSLTRPPAGPKDTGALPSHATHLTFARGRA